MTVSAVTKYETVTYILYVKCIPDLTRRKIKPEIDWDGLEELKVKSRPTFGSRKKTLRVPQAPPVLAGTPGGYY